MISRLNAYLSQRRRQSSVVATTNQSISWDFFSSLRPFLFNLFSIKSHHWAIEWDLFLSSLSLSFSLHSACANVWVWTRLLFAFYHTNVYIHQGPGIHHFQYIKKCLQIENGQLTWFVVWPQFILFKSMKSGKNPYDSLTMHENGPCMRMVFFTTTHDLREYSYLQNWSDSFAFSPYMCVTLGSVVHILSFMRFAMDFRHENVCDESLDGQCDAHSEKIK